MCFFGVAALPLLHFSEIPDSLFVSKEIGLLFCSGLCCLSAALFWGQMVRFSVLDIVAFVFLVAVPVFQYLFLPNISFFSVSSSLSYYAIFSVVSIIAKCDQRFAVRVFLECCLAVFHLVLLAAILQDLKLLRYTYPGGMATAFFSNPSLFGIYLAFSIVVLFSFIGSDEWKNQKTIYLCLIVLLAVCYMLKSESRAALVAILGCSVMYAPIRKVMIGSFKGIVFTIIVGFFLLTALYVLKPESANGRILIWLSSLSMLGENWLFGVGIEKFSVSFLRHQAIVLDNDLFYKSLGMYADETRTAFNDVLHFSCERGVLGFICVLYIFRVLFSNRKSCYGFASHNFHKIKTLAVLLVLAGLFSYPLQTIPMAILFWALLGLLAAYSSTKCTINGRLFHVFISVAGIAFLCVGIGKYRAYKEWFSLEQRMSYKELKAMESLLPFLNDDASFLISLSKLYRVNGDLNKSIGFAEKAIRLSPNREHHYHLAELYKRNKQPDKSEQVYRFVEKSIPHLIKPKYLRLMLYYEYDCEKFVFNATEVLLFKPKIESKTVLELKGEIKRKLEQESSPSKKKSQK